MVQGAIILDRRAAGAEDLQPIVEPRQPMGANCWQWRPSWGWKPNLGETGLPASIFCSGAASLSDCQESADWPEDLHAAQEEKVVLFCMGFQFAFACPWHR
jgi:hypothetical protein